MRRDGGAGNADPFFQHDEDPFSDPFFQVGSPWHCGNTVHNLTPKFFNPEFTPVAAVALSILQH